MNSSRTKTATRAGGESAATINSRAIDLNDRESEAFVFVGDADCLAHQGTRRGSINVLSFARLLSRRGVSTKIMVGNHFFPLEEKLWNAAGFECVATHCNADNHIKQVVRDVVRNGAKRVCLGSGDHTFADLVTELKRENGVEVHVLSPRSSLSRRLRDVAAGYAWTDSFMAEAA